MFGTFGAAEASPLTCAWMQPCLPALQDVHRQAVSFWASQRSSREMGRSSVLQSECQGRVDVLMTGSLLSVVILNIQPCFSSGGSWWEQGEQPQRHDLVSFGRLTEQPCSCLIASPRKKSLTRGRFCTSWNYWLKRKHAQSSVCENKLLHMKICRTHQESSRTP